MTFEPLSDHFPNIPVPPVPSAPSLPASLLLSDVPTTPLTWLWPARIPRGQLTLLDAAPGCNPSLFALTLAASISSGSPLPDGTSTTQGNVILFAPYDSASSTLKPRLQAAGGDPAHVLPFLDPAITELAQQTNCAILLIRSLRAPIANPLRSPAPSSPLFEAVRSRILLTPAPDNENHTLLLTTHHPLCSPPAILAYDHEAGRKMLIRMKLAGELHSPARGLYTTTNHPSLSALTNATPPVPNVPTVPTLPSPSIANVQTIPTVPTIHIPKSPHPPVGADVPYPSPLTSIPFHELPHSLLLRNPDLFKTKNCTSRCSVVL